MRRSRARFIRELGILRLSREEIAAKCALAGYRRPSSQAMHRALTYSPTGMPRGRPRKTPSFKQLAAELVDAYQAAVDAGVPLAVTRRLKNVVVLAEEMLDQEEKTKCHSKL